MAETSIEINRRALPKSRSENLLTENKKIPRSSTNFDLFGIKSGAVQRSPSSNFRTLKEISRSPVSERLHVKSSDGRYVIPIPFTLKLPPKLNTEQVSPSGKDLKDSSGPSLPHRHSKLVFTGTEYEKMGYLSESDNDESEIKMYPVSTPSPKNTCVKFSSERGVSMEESGTTKNESATNVSIKPSKEPRRSGIQELMMKRKTLSHPSLSFEQPDKRKNSNLNNMAPEANRVPGSFRLFDANVGNYKVLRNQKMAENVEKNVSGEKPLPREHMHENLVHEAELRNRNKHAVAENSVKLSSKNHSQGHAEIRNPLRSSGIYPSSQRQLLKRSSHVSGGKRKSLIRRSKGLDDINSVKMYESPKNENDKDSFGSAPEFFPISNGNLLYETENSFKENLDSGLREYSSQQNDGHPGTVQRGKKDRNLLPYSTQQGNCYPNKVHSGHDVSSKDMFSPKSRHMRRNSESNVVTFQEINTAKSFGEGISKINRYQTVFCSDNQRDSSNSHIYLPRGHTNMVSFDNVNDTLSPEIHDTGLQGHFNLDEYNKGVGKSFYFPNSTENATNADIVRKQAISEEAFKSKFNNAFDYINRSGQIVIPDMNELENVTSEMNGENIILRNDCKNNRGYNRFFDPFPNTERVQERHRSLDAQTDITTLSKKLSERNFEPLPLFENKQRKDNTRKARHARRKSMFSLDEITQDKRYESQGYNLPRSNSFSSNPSITAKCFPAQKDSMRLSTSQVHDEVEYLKSPRYDKKSRNFSPFPVDLLYNFDFERDMKESTIMAARSPPEIKYNEAKKTPSIASKTDSSTSSTSNSDVLSRESNALTKATSVSDYGSISNEKKEDSFINKIPENNSSYSNGSFREPFLERERINKAHDHDNQSDFDESDLMSIYSKYKKRHMIRDVSNESNSSHGSCFSSNQSIKSEENLNLRSAEAIEAQRVKSKNSNLHCAYLTNQPLGYGERSYLSRGMTRSKSQSLDFLDLLQKRFRNLKVHSLNPVSNYSDYKGPTHDFQTYMKQCTKYLDAE